MSISPIFTITAGRGVMLLTKRKKAQVGAASSAQFLSEALMSSGQGPGHLPERPSEAGPAADIDQKGWNGNGAAHAGNGHGLPIHPLDHHSAQAPEQSRGHQKKYAFNPWCHG